MEKSEHLQQDLLKSVLEVSNILKQRRPDLGTSIIPVLLDAEILLLKNDLSDADLTWIDEKIINYLCHFKCLYDFCPLEQLTGETDQARWQRWGQILDQMKSRAILLCKGAKKRRRRSNV